MYGTKEDADEAMLSFQDDKKIQVETRIPLKEYLSVSQIRWTLIDDLREVPYGDLPLLLADFKELVADHVYLKYKVDHTETKRLIQEFDQAKAAKDVQDYKENQQKSETDSGHHSKKEDL